MDLGLSYVDCQMLTLHLFSTSAGLLESLLSLQLDPTTGLAVSGWLEAKEGNQWNIRTGQDGEDREGPQLVFNIVPGVHYQLGRHQQPTTFIFSFLFLYSVWAVFGEGRLLARLRNVDIKIPADIRKYKKKFGLHVPLARL